MRLLARLLGPVLLAVAVGSGCGDSGSAPTVLAPGATAGLDQRGTYPVGVRTLDLTDTSRPDDRSSNGPRFLKTEVWYPAAESARGAAAAPAADWVPPALKPLLPVLTIRGNKLFDFTTGAVRGAGVAPGPFPLVVFSHGNQAARYQSFTLCEHLASHGFVVAAPDHIGNAVISQRADGSLLFYDDPFGVPALERRIADASFVITTMIEMGAAGSGTFLDGAITTARGVGLAGHSFGGATTVATAARDSRITAAVPMAAAIFEEQMPPLAIPSITFVGAEDKTVGLEANAGSRAIFEGSVPPRAWVSIRDAGHFTFADSCLLLPGLFLADGCGEGTRFADGSTFPFIGHDEAFAIMDSISTAFFGTTLQGDATLGRLLRANPAPDAMDYEPVGF